MKRTIVYIDGFNLYYGLLRGTCAKWLDLYAFAKALLAPDHDIIVVKYFTSRVNYNKRTPEKKEHQEVYLRALAHREKIEIIEGFYKTRDAARRGTRAAGGESPQAGRGDLGADGRTYPLWFAIGGGGVPLRPGRDIERRCRAAHHQPSLQRTSPHRLRLLLGVPASRSADDA